MGLDEDNINIYTIKNFLNENKDKIKKKFNKKYDSDNDNNKTIIFPPCVVVKNIYNLINIVHNNINIIL